MSVETAVAPAEAPVIERDSRPFQYVMIAISLAVLTGLEICLYYIEKNNPSVPSAAIIIPLFTLAALKFVIVALYFMHLKHDQPIFKRYFVLGIAAAAVLYLIVLASLRIFG